MTEKQGEVWLAEAMAETKVGRDMKVLPAVALPVGDIVSIAIQAFGAPQRELKQNGYFRAGEDGEVAVRLTDGIWFDHKNKVGGGRKSLLRTAATAIPASARRAKEILADDSKLIVVPSVRREATPSQRILAAQRRYHEARPVSGTPGLDYLVSRGIEAAADQYRYELATGYLVAPICRIDTPDIVGVHEIKLDANGSKRTDVEEAKTTAGFRKNRGVVFHGSEPDTPIVAAESVEAATSIWLAMNRRWTVIATLSHARSIRLPRIAKGKRGALIIARDDDPYKGASHKSAGALGRWASERRYDVFHAWPSSKRGLTKRDLNDTHMESGLGAVRERIEAAIPVFVEDTAIDLEDVDLLLSDDDIAAIRKNHRLRNEHANGWFDDQIKKERPVIVSSGTVGAGKTHGNIDAILRLDLQSDEYVLVAAPEHGLSDEIAARYSAPRDQGGTGLKAVVIRGMDAIDPDAIQPTDPNEDRVKMCTNLKEVQQAAKLKVDIEKEICPVCPAFNTCAYQKQKRAFREECKADRPKILVVSHKLLKGGRLPKGFAGQDHARDCVAQFVDEAPTANMVTTLKIKRSRLDLPTSHLKLEPELRDVLRRCRDNIGTWVDKHTTAGFEPVEVALDPNDLSDDVLQLAIASASGDGAHVPSLYRMEMNRILKEEDVVRWQDRKDNESVDDLAALGRALETCSVSCSKNGAKLAWKHGDRRMWIQRERDGDVFICISNCSESKKLDKVPVIITDALAQPVLIEKTFGTITRTIDFKVRAPHQIIWQDYSQSWSKQQLCIKWNRQRLARDIVKKARGRRSVLISNIDFEKEILEEILALAPDLDMDTAHFNAIAGKNRWEKHKCTFIVGAPVPNQEAIQDLARPYGSEIRGDNDKMWETRDAKRLVLIGGRLAEENVKINVGRDDIETAHLDQIAGQVEQAVGRPRGIRRTEEDPCEVYVYGQAILSFPVRKMPAPGAETLLEESIREHGVFVLDAAKHAKIVGMNARTARDRVFREREKITDEMVEGIVSFRFQLQGAGQRFAAGWYDPARMTPCQLRSLIEDKLGTVAVFDSHPATSLRADQYDHDLYGQSKGVPAAPADQVDDDDEVDDLVREIERIEAARMAAAIETEAGPRDPHRLN
ncbi:DUF7146 domain-containing protein [Bradyrhizobium elkanii]|uniref:DUF7146 domain-containing protein n=1 Tax=Bradyrhizobium elkanii TaxID=29448 RepID=UPI003512E0BB